MKQAPRLVDYLEHMQQAAAEAIGFVHGMDKAAFLADHRTQRAVVFDLVILGEAAGNVLSKHSSFAEDHTEIPWRVIRATRNRMAHGYFEIDLDVIWDTVHMALPPLLVQLPATLQAAKDSLTQDDPPKPTAAS